MALDINPTTFPRLTMGAWVRPKSGKTIRHLISHDNQIYDRDIAIDHRGGGVGWSAFRGNGVLGFIPVRLNEWQFVAVVYDQPAQTVLLYVDGQTRMSAGNLGGGHTFTRIGASPCCDTGIEGDVDNVFFIAEDLSVTRLDEIRAGGIMAIPTCPVFMRQPEDVGVCDGCDAELRVVAMGSGAISYLWRKADGIGGWLPLADGPTGTGSTIAGAGTPTLIITNIGPADGNLYNCLVGNTCGEAESNAARVGQSPCYADCDCSQVLDIFTSCASATGSAPATRMPATAIRPRARACVTSLTSCASETHSAPDARSSPFLTSNRR